MATYKLIPKGKDQFRLQVKYIEKQTGKLYFVERTIPQASWREEVFGQVEEVAKLRKGSSA